MWIPTYSIRRLGIVLFMAILGASAHAQPVQFERYSTGEGLTSYAVTAVLQDSRGFLWIGTFDGLNRYDGARFVAYPPDGEYLSDNSVMPGALLEHAGGLWIGTRRGLNRLDLRTNRVEHFLEPEPDNPAMFDGAITALAATDSATLWVGMLDGIRRYDSASGQFTAYPVDLDSTSNAKYVLALHARPDGELWVGTGVGLFVYDAGSDAFTPVETPNPFPGTSVTAMYTASDGALWVGILGGGVARIEPATGQWSMLRQPRKDILDPIENRIHAITQDAEGTMWAASFGEGVCAYAGTPNDWQCATHDVSDSRTLSNDQTTSLLVDRAGNLFVGTWNGLSKRLSRKAFHIYTADHNNHGLYISHPRVNAIHEDRDGRLWVGLYGEGLDRLDREAGTRAHFEAGTHPDSLSSNEVWSITEDVAGDVWIATGGGGVNRFDPTRRVFRRYLPDTTDHASIPETLIYSVFEDSRQRLWFGLVTEGLARYDPEADGFIHLAYRPGTDSGPSHYSVWPVIEDRQGAIWLGTVGGGLNRIREPGRFERIPNVPNMPLQIARMKVVSLALAADGAIWAGTTGDGVVRVDPETGAMRTFTTLDSLSHQSVTCVLPGDGGDMWVATAGGLSLYDADAASFTVTYTASDGLPEAAFLDGACHKSRRGELFFGTNDGLVAFFPSEIQTNPIPPEMAITGLDLFGSPHELEAAVETVRDVRLRYNQNEVTIHFAAMEYTEPARNRYSYQLEGVDAGWIETENAMARYPNLSPGEYLFRVKGANGDGVWTDRHATLLITIRSHWFWWWWVQGLLWSAVLFGAWTLARSRLKTRLRTSQLERQVASEREASRLEMVKDLHDAVGGEMSAIVLRLEFLARSEHLAGDIRREMRQIWDNARGVSSYLGDATWAIDPGKDRLADLVDRLEDLVYHLFPEGNAVFERPEILPDRVVGGKERQQLYRLAMLALTNAQKHSAASRVEMRVGIEQGMLRMIVRDNGVGFDVGAIHGGYGLGHMRDRAAAIGAQLQVTSAPGDGTTVAVQWIIT